MNNIIFLLLFDFLLPADTIPEFKINPEKDKEETFLLSEFTSSIKYIKLQTTQTSLISEVLKIQTDKESLFVLSREAKYSRLFQFDLNGTFINEIGAPGRGPDEYSTVLDFTLDKSSKTIYILDGMGKILSFTYSGKHLKTIKLESNPTSILHFNNSLFLFTAWPDYSLNKGFGIEIRPLEDKKQIVYLLNRKQIKYQRQQGVLIYPNYFYGLESNSLRFFESKFDTLYEINTRFIVRPKLVINLNKNQPRNLLTSEDYYNAHKEFNTLFNTLIVKDFMFFSVVTARPSCTYFYILNVKTGETRKHNVTKDKMYLYNDFDNGPPIKLQGLAEEGVLYSSVDCFDLKDELAHNADKKVKSPNKAFLSKLVKESDLSDNPVIMLITVK